MSVWQLTFEAPKGQRHPQYLSSKGILATPSGTFTAREPTETWTFWGLLLHHIFRPCFFFPTIDLFFAVCRRHNSCLVCPGNLGYGLVEVVELGANCWVVVCPAPGADLNVHKWDPPNRRGFICSIILPLVLMKILRYEHSCTCWKYGKLHACEKAHGSIPFGHSSKMFKVICGIDANKALFDANKTPNPFAGFAEQQHVFREGWNVEISFWVSRKRSIDTTYTLNMHIGTSSLSLSLSLLRDEIE